MEIQFVMQLIVIACYMKFWKSVRLAKLLEKSLIFAQQIVAAYTVTVYDGNVINAWCFYDIYVLSVEI